MASANTLVHVFKVQPQQTEPKQRKSDNRKLNKGTGRGANYRSIHQINFTSVAKLGLGIRQVRMANELVGAYTADKVTQRTVETALTFAQYGVGVAVAGPIGIAYAAGDLAFRGANFQIKKSRDNRMARYMRDISGNESRNHSRAGGDKIW